MQKIFFVAALDVGKKSKLKTIKVKPNNLNLDLIN